jgi:hypothetical protein
MERRRNVTVTEYERHRVKHPACRWRIADPGALLDHIVVHKKPDPDLWKRVRRVYNLCGGLPLNSEWEFLIDRAVAEEELLQGGVVAEEGQGSVDDHRRWRVQGRRVRQGLIG